MRVPVCRIPMEYDLEPQGVYSFLSGGKPAVVSKPMDFAPTCHILLSNHGEIHQLAGCPWSSHVGPPQKNVERSLFSPSSSQSSHLSPILPPKSPWKVCKVEGGRAQLRDGIQTQAPQSCEQFLIASAPAEPGTGRLRPCFGRSNVNLNWDDGWFIKIEMDIEWEYTVPMVIYFRNDDLVIDSHWNS